MNGKYVSKTLKKLAIETAQDQTLGQTAYRIILHAIGAMKNKFNYHITHSSLAREFGIPRPQVTKAINDLIRRDYLVKISAGDYRIHNRFLVMCHQLESPQKKGDKEMNLQVRVKEDIPAVHVYLDDLDDDDRYEMVGMLRGLMCAIDNCNNISGFTNDLVDEALEDEVPVRLEFSSVEKAHHFKDCIQYYFADHILEDLKVKRLFKKTRH